MVLAPNALAMLLGALGLYADPDYQEAKRIRQRSTSHGTMVLASELEPPKR